MALISTHRIEGDPEENVLGSRCFLFFYIVHYIFNGGNRRIANIVIYYFQLHNRIEVERGYQRRGRVLGKYKGRSGGVAVRYARRRQY